MARKNGSLNTPGYTWEPKLFGLGSRGPYHLQSWPLFRSHSLVMRAVQNLRVVLFDDGPSPVPRQQQNPAIEFRCKESRYEVSGSAGHRRSHASTASKSGATCPAAGGAARPAAFLSVHSWLVLLRAQSESWRLCATPAPPRGTVIRTLASCQPCGESSKKGTSSTSMPWDDDMTAMGSGSETTTLPGKQLQLHEGQSLVTPSCSRQMPT